MRKSYSTVIPAEMDSISLWRLVIWVMRTCPMAPDPEHNSVTFLVKRLSSTSKVSTYCWYSRSCWVIYKLAVAIDEVSSCWETESETIFSFNSMTLLRRTDSCTSRAKEWLRREVDKITFKFIVFTGDLNSPFIDHHFKGKLEGVDFLNPYIKLGTLWKSNFITENNVPIRRNRLRRTYTIAFLLHIRSLRRRGWILLRLVWISFFCLQNFLRNFSWIVVRFVRHSRLEIQLDWQSIPPSR